MSAAGTYNTLWFILVLLFHSRSPVTWQPTSSFWSLPHPPPSQNLSKLKRARRIPGSLASKQLRFCRLCYIFQLILNGSTQSPLFFADFFLIFDNHFRKNSVLVFRSFDNLLKLFDFLKIFQMQQAQK